MRLIFTLPPVELLQLFMLNVRQKTSLYSFKSVFTVYLQTKVLRVKFTFKFSNDGSITFWA